MGKFTEKDIENMLSKTESTLPQFDKNVDFPEQKTVPIRRRSYRAILLAACLTALCLSVVAVFAFSNREGDVESGYSQDDASAFVSGVSLYPPSDSSGFTNESYDFPDISEGEMSTAGDSSAPENDNSENEPSPPAVVYPSGNSFYVGQGLDSNKTPDQYFAENPHEYLGGKIRLPVFSRTQMTLDERKLKIEEFSETLGISFEFDESMHNITGDCRGASANNRYSVNVGEYGDWYFIAYSADYNSLRADADNYEAFVNATDGFINKYACLFEDGEYSYLCTSSDSRVYVSVNNLSRNGSIASSMPAYTFVFKKISANRYTLNSIEYKNIGEALGEYETVLYGTALNEMFANRFYSVHGFTFGDEDTFRVVGYDVRYLTKSEESLICPYYAFVVMVNPESEESYFRTLFVPAIYSPEPEPSTSEQPA